MTILKFAIAKYYVNVSNKEPFYEVITCIYTVRRDHIYHMDFGLYWIWSPAIVYVIILYYSKNDFFVPYIIVMKLYEQIGIIWYFKISAMKQQPVMFNFTVPFHVNFCLFLFSNKIMIGWRGILRYENNEMCIIHIWNMSTFNKTLCVLREQINR